MLSIIYYTALLYCNMLSCVKVEMAYPYLSKRVTVVSPSPYLVNYYIIYYIIVSYIYIIYTELYFAVFYRRWKWHSHPFHKGDCCIPISLYNIVHMRTQYTLTWFSIISIPSSRLWRRRWHTHLSHKGDCGIPKVNVLYNRIKLYI